MTADSAATDLPEDTGPPEADIDALHGDEVGLPAGRVIAGMFAFGLLVVAGFWSYWAIYDRPLAPLRERIQARLTEADLPGIAVQIAAGTERRSDVRELRVILRTPFDPHSDRTSETVFQTVAATAAGWDAAAGYDQFVVIQYDKISITPSDYWRRAVPVESLGK